MDSVPYIFCEDVLERLSKENLYTMAELSGQWRSAAQRFIEKRQTFNITISKDSEEWFYSIANENTVDIGKGPHSHEEFLSMDRRYLEVYGIFILFDPLQSNARKFRCSKEEMARRVVPCLTLRMRPDSSLFFMSDCPKEFTLECLDMFRGCFSFGYLQLVYVGPESEEFLALQLKNNPFLCSISLYSWPKTDATEQLLLTFLNSRKKRSLNMTQFPDIQSPIKVTIEIVKAAVDSWVSGEEKRYLDVEGLIGIATAEILSIPLPENVAVREEEGEQEGNFCARWTKEDGSSLQCEFDFSINHVSIENSDSANWHGTPFY